MLRAVLATAAGVVVGFLVVYAIQATGHRIWPVATGVDLRDRQAMTAFMAGLPTGALVWVVVAWVLGAYAASMTALLVARRRRGAGLAAAGLMLLATIANLLSIPHPVWMAVAGLGGMLAAAWLSDRLFGPRRA